MFGLTDSSQRYKKLTHPNLNFPMVAQMFKRSLEKREKIKRAYNKEMKKNGKNTGVKLKIVPK